MRTGFTSAAALARSSRGEQTKEQLLAAAAEERQARQEQRRQRDAALRIQRCWRATRAWHAAREDLLVSWQQRWGAVDRPEAVDLLALLPPLIVCSRRRSDGALTPRALGAPALARGLALFAASCPGSLAQALSEPKLALRAAFLAAATVSLAASALAHPPASDNPDVVAAVCGRAIGCASDTAAWAGAPEGAYTRFLRRCLAPCACSLGHLLGGGGATGRSGPLLSILMKALTGSDATLSGDAAEALVSWVLSTPRGLAAAPPEVLTALREPGVLQGVLRAMAQRRGPASGAVWALTHAVQLMDARGGDAALVGAFLDAVTALSHQGSAPAVLRAAAGDACDAIRQAAAALESPPMLQMLLGSGVPAERLASFYWPMLAKSTSGINRMDALRVLNTLAFSPQLLPVLWGHCSRELKIQQSLALDGQPAAWEPSPLCHGLVGVPPHCVAPLGVFASALEHVLLVLSDEEFHSAQRPLPLHQTRAVAAAVNTLVICTYLPRGAAHGTRATGLDAERAAVLDACTQLLRSLVARNARRQYCDDALWLAPARHVTMHIPAAARAFAASAEDGPGTTRDLLVSCPHARPFSERAAVFRALCSSDRQLRRASAQPGSADARAAEPMGGGPVIKLTIRRSHLLEDSLTGLSSHGGDELRNRVFVRFVNAAGASEAGIDQGGLFKEWLTESVGALCDPRRGLFAATHDGCLSVSAAAAASHEGRMLLHLAGRIVGKALYEGVLLDVAFAPFLVAALLRRPLSLDDLPALDPGLHRSLLAVKAYDGDVSDMCLDFTASTDDGAGGALTTELLPNGAQVPVTNDNRLSYVAAVADWRLRGVVEPGVSAFRSGLATLIPLHWLSLFLPSELNTLISGGSTDFDVDDLAKYCAYANGYGPTSRPVTMFFDVLRSFTPQQRAQLLKFTTSCSKPPYGGFKHLHPPFTLAKIDVGASFFAAIAGPDVERLPSASTCFCRLNLPNYRRQSTMREKLLMAITSASGFDLS